jgi:UDP-N-acetylglucosamine--N-acetylmuramyl-(pentapeptide) pyrophosphoryl-undecaprenol N-acetylglucosamine transferase
MTQEKKSKLIIMCGGTGGHFYPGLSVARAFKLKGGACKLFLIGKHSENQLQIAKEFDVKSEILPKLPIPLGLFGKIKYVISLKLRIFQALKLLRKENPDFVLGMGSFTSVPAIIAAKLCSIPIFLHDGNSYIGKANLAMSRFALKIALAFPPQNSQKLKTDYIITGMPLREEIHPDYVAGKFNPTSEENRLSGGGIKEFIKSFNSQFCREFKEESKTILIFGGSQGARTFNSTIPKAIRILNQDYQRKQRGMNRDIEEARLLPIKPTGRIEKLMNNESGMGCNLQIIHICGAGNSVEVKARYNDNDTYIIEESKQLIIDGTEDMGLLYSMADLVICRAGGSTIAELALYGKSAILVPYPYATNDHQRINGEYYTAAGNSIIINDTDCNPKMLAENINARLNVDPLENQDKAKKLAYPNAADNVIDMLFSDSI